MYNSSSAECVCVYIFMYICACKAGPPEPNSYIPENHCSRFPTDLQFMMFLQPSLYQISSLRLFQQIFVLRVEIKKCQYTLLNQIPRILRSCFLEIGN